MSRISHIFILYKICEKLTKSNAIFINLDLPSVLHLIIMHYSTRGTLIECMYSLETHAMLGGCCLCGTGEEPSKKCSWWFMQHILNLQD
ncbi:unnamed protein product [Blepharisma stoltei]|uniref:Uncharacterized protein n=1 Tax=Blepharisma stoltei TaxID=1481888 RepID=A0AAU9K2K1_9CILI|nr:unnamed protein product [Blepharisma stoltei]